MAINWIGPDRWDDFCHLWRQIGCHMLAPKPSKPRPRYSACSECGASFQVEPGAPLPPHSFRGKPCVYGVAE